MNKGGEETTKHGLGGREQKQNVPLIVCACVCLVTPELSLLGGDGEGQEEKEKKSANMQQLFMFGAPKNT